MANKNGGSIDNVRRLWMWSNQKMKFVTFIHNDDVKCFRMVINGTHKLLVMNRIKFKDHSLIKRWQANEKNECDGWDVQG
jgi:hypothetical protein